MGAAIMRSGTLSLFKRYLVLAWVFALLPLFSSSVPAQQKPARQSAQKAVDGTGTATNPAAINVSYTNKIKEYTTTSYFMTELVDHLPLSNTVPAPDKILGYAIGTPNKLTYTKDIYRYYQ